jgi:hypothetical protein
VSLSSVVLGECDAVYKNNMHATEVLQQEISATVICVSGETVAAGLRNFRRWLQMFLDTDGTNIEFFLRYCQSLKATELRDTKYSDVCYVVR